MKRTIFSFFIVFFSTFAIANESKCFFIEDNTYWEEDIEHCRYDCAHPYMHRVEVYLGGENNLGSSKPSYSKDFELSDKTFTDHIVKSDYYDISRGQQIKNDVYEVCMTKKSERYIKKQEQLKKEEQMKKELKSIPEKLFGLLF